jgi:diadenylate cyclase
LEVAKALGYNNIESEDELEEYGVSSKGYRLLYSTNLPSIVVRNVVETYKTLPELMKAKFEDLTTIPGVGKRRAEVILNALDKKKRNQEELNFLTSSEENAPKVGS